MRTEIMVAVAAVVATVAPLFAAQNFERDEGWVLYTNPNAALSSGAVVDIGGRYGIAKVDIASNATGVVSTRGVWVLTLATNQVISVGDKLYWDSSASQATETATADKFLGLAVTAVTTVASTGKVKIDINSPLRAVVAGVDTAAYDADLAAIAALAKTANNFLMGNGTAWTLVTPANARTGLGLGTMALIATNAATITGGYISGITDLAVADGGTGASSASAARSNLGCGTMAITATNAATITGGYVVGITDIAVADGGTGASSAAAARNNLGCGSMAITATNAATITGGYVVGITDLAVADGGTGASDAATARNNLGIGSCGTQGTNAVLLTGGTIAGTTITGGSVGGATLAPQAISITGIATNTITGNVVVWTPTGVCTSYLANPGSVKVPVWMYSDGASVIIRDTGNVKAAGDITIGADDAVSLVPISASVWVQGSAVVNN